MDDTSRLQLFVEVKNVLDKLELDINNIKGQRQDNEAIMSEKHRSVQRRLLEINLGAFYTPFWLS